MTFLEKLDSLKEARGDNNMSLAKNAGIPPTTIYNLYNRGYANMKLSTLQALCDYFGVSLDYLAKDDKENDPEITDGIVAKHQEYLTVYNALNPANRRLLLGIAALLLQEQQRSPDFPH